MPKNAWLWIAIIWTIVIAVLCLVRFGELPDLGVKETDKYVHATLHFFFTVFWSRYLIGKRALPRLGILGRVLLISVVYGSLIEIAQGLFTTTRQADLKDVAANFAGAALAVLAMAILGRKRQDRQNI